MLAPPEILFIFFWSIDVFGNQKLWKTYAKLTALQFLSDLLLWATCTRKMKKTEDLVANPLAKTLRKLDFFRKTGFFEREYLKTRPMKDFISLIKITNRLETTRKTVRASPIRVVDRHFFSKRRCTIAKTSKNTSKITIFEKSVFSSENIWKPARWKILFLW